MAEVVQSHIEEMLPEVYELQQLGVLSSAEGKSVIKTRTDFEYKMRRRISKKQDFLRFIDFELKLEKLKQSRILQLGLNDVSEGARYRSLQRIHFIFQLSHGFPSIPRLMRGYDRTALKAVYLDVCLLHTCITSYTDT